MLQVQGRSDLFLGLEVIKKTIAIGPLCVGAFVGILPMLYCSIITSIISYFLNSYYSGRMIGYSSWMQIKDFAPSYGIAIVIAFCVFFLKYLPLSYWIVLPLQLLLGTILFYILSREMEEYNELRSVVMQIIKEKGKIKFSKR